VEELRDKMWEVAAVRWIAEATSLGREEVYKSLCDQVQAMLAGAENALGRVEKASTQVQQPASELTESVSYVYAIQVGRNGPIKIGTTKNSPESRMAALQTGHHEKLQLLGAVEGDQAIERGAHEALRAYRLHGEWFGPSDAVLAYVAALTRPNASDEQILKAIKAAR